MTLYLTREDVVDVINSNLPASAVLSELRSSMGELRDGL
jgi:hypothetical protein